MPRISQLLSLLAVCLAGCVGEPSHARERGDRMLEEASVAVTITSGEPGAPTEMISVSLSKGKHALSVQRQSQGQAVQKETRAISSREFSAIWELVARHKLRAWLPEENLGDAFDFGEKRVRIEWRSLATRNPLVHDVAWTQPIGNEEGIQELLKELGNLARNHFQEVKPIYIR